MMDIIHLSYFLKINLAIILLFMAYLLIFKRSGHFLFNRFYLIFIPILGFLLPSIPKISGIPDIQREFIVTSSSQVAEPAINILMEPFPVAHYVSNSWTWYETLVIMYLSVLSIMMMRLAGQIAKILVMKSRSVRISESKPIFHVPGISQNCSFFRWIFWHRHHITPEDESVILHETIHGRQHHSLDIILIEVFRAIFWINPIIHYMCKEVKKVHEYIADRAVLQHFDRRQYIEVLIKFSSRKTPALAVPFASSIKRRIRMMNQPRPRMSRGIYSILFPFSVLMNYAFTSPAFQDLTDQLKKLSSTEIARSGMPQANDHLIWGNLVFPIQSRPSSDREKPCHILIKASILKEDLLRLQSDSMFFKSSFLSESALKNTKFRQEYDNMKLEDSLRITTVKGEGYFGLLDQKITNQLGNAQDGEYVRIYVRSDSISFTVWFRINDVKSMKDFVLWGYQKYPLNQLCQISTAEFENNKNLIPVLFKDLTPQKLPVQFILANNREVIACEDLNSCHLDNANILQMRFAKEYQTFHLGTTPIKPRTEFFRDLFEPIIMDSEDNIYVTRSSLYSTTESRIEIEEIPALLVWGNEKFLLYQSSSHHFRAPREFDVSGTKDLLTEFPKIYLGNKNSLTRLFAKVKYLDRESIPEEFNIAFDLENQSILQGERALEELTRKIKPNDFIEISEIRHQYSSDSGGKFGIMVKDKVSGIYKDGRVLWSPYITYEKLMELYPDHL